MKVTSGFVFVFLVLFTGISLVSGEQASEPQLLGNWTGTSVGHHSDVGYIGEDTFTYTLAILEQNGRVLNGTLYEEGINGHKEYPFSGIIGQDMKTLYIADYDKGYNTGFIVDDKVIELILLVDGNDGLSEVCTLNRAEKI